jgi:hypothetical protein
MTLNPSLFAKINLRVIFFGSYTNGFGSDGLAGDEALGVAAALSAPELEFVVVSPFPLLSRVGSWGFCSPSAD